MFRSSSKFSYSVLIQLHSLEMDSKEVFDVDGAVRHLMELVETNLRKASEDSDVSSNMPYILFRG